MHRRVTSCRLSAKASPVRYPENTVANLAQPEGFTVPDQNSLHPKLLMNARVVNRRQYISGHAKFSIGNNQKVGTRPLRLTQVSYGRLDRVSDIGAAMKARRKEARKRNQALHVLIEWRTPQFA